MDADSGINWTDRRQYGQRLKYSQVLNQLIPYISSDSKKSEYLTDLGDGTYLITPTFNPYKLKHVLIYDPQNKYIYKTPVKDIYKKYKVIKDGVDKFIKEKFENKVPQQKQGGSIKKYKDPPGPLWGENFDLFSNEGDFVEWDKSKRYKVTSSDKGKTFYPEERVGNVTNEKVPNDNQYDAEPYGKEIQELGWYKQFQNVLDNNPELAESWASGYKDRNSGNIGNVWDSWFINGSFSHDNFKKRNVPYDNVGGTGHDVNKGTRYWDIDNNDWVKVVDIKGGNYDFTGDEDYIDPNNPLITVKYVKQKNTNTGTNAGIDTDGKKSSQVTATFGKNNSFLNMANIRKILPYLGETQRWLATAASNKELYDKSLINPLYTSAPHFEMNQYRDLAAEIQGQQAAATVNALGSTPLTSDASLTANQQLDADKLANQYKQQGLTTSAKKAEETGLRAVLQSKENEIKAVDNANANAKARYTADAYNQQQELGYLQKRWNNNDTYSKAMQSLLQKDMDERTALVEQQLKQYLAANYDYTQNPEYISLQNDLQDHIKRHGSSAEFDKEKLQRMAQIKRDMSTQHAYEMIKQLAALRGYSNINQYIPEELKKATRVDKNGGVLLASGGRISDEARIKIAKIKDELERQKLFQRSIEHSIKVNDKKLDQLSNTMQKLLMNMVK